jgi:hypothetical protein
MVVAGRSLTVGHGPRSKMTHVVIGVRRLQLVAVVGSPVNSVVGSRALQRRVEQTGVSAR